jgi:hypothetical protein
MIPNACVRRRPNLGNRASPDDHEIRPFLLRFFSYRANDFANGDANGCDDTGGFQHRQDIAPRLVSNLLLQASFSLERWPVADGTDDVKESQGGSRSRAEIIRPPHESGCVRGGAQRTQDVFRQLQGRLSPGVRGRPHGTLRIMQHP